VAEGGDGLVGYQDTQARGFDRFVVRDWTRQIRYEERLSFENLIDQSLKQRETCKRGWQSAS
jgi:hypothetical protein